MAYYEDDFLHTILDSAQVIAVVGHSDRPFRTSYQIGRLLKTLGYKVYVVNPTISHVEEDRAYPSLASLPEPVDIVNVFRRSQFLDGVVDEAIAAQAPVVWSQLGVIDQHAADKAESAGLKMVMDRCIKVEYYRLMPLHR